MMTNGQSKVSGWISRFETFPVVGKLFGQEDSVVAIEEMDKYLEVQRLSFQCAQEIANLIQPGWTEQRAAQLMEVWLKDHGVTLFFHKAFAWWGDRTRFAGVKTYWDYMPSKRVLCEGDVFILDVAPIKDGYVADIGFSGRIGENKEYDKALRDLYEFRTEIPNWVMGDFGKASSLWVKVDQQIKAMGYENIHAAYPFGVLGHRLRRLKQGPSASFIHFGWQSYWDYLSRGLFGQILNQDFAGSMDGLWAVEPHIGTPNFGIKFEEILCVQGGRAYWIDDAPRFHSERP